MVQGDPTKNNVAFSPSGILPYTLKFKNPWNIIWSIILIISTLFYVAEIICKSPFCRETTKQQSKIIISFHNYGHWFIIKNNRHGIIIQNHWFIMDIILFKIMDIDMLFKIMNIDILFKMMDIYYSYLITNQTKL